MSCLNIGDWEISLGKVGVDDDIGDDGCELTFIVELSMFVVLSDLLILYISIVYRYDIRFNCSRGSIAELLLNLIPDSLKSKYRNYENLIKKYINVEWSKLFTSVCLKENLWSSYTNYTTLKIIVELRENTNLYVL